MVYKFSVGRVKLKQGLVTMKEIFTTTDIEINHTISITKEVDPNGIVTDIMKEEENTEIRMTYATDMFDTTLVSGSDYDIVLEAGAEGGGITATLASCKLTGYDVRTAQDTFATTTLTFTKQGALDSTPGETPTKQRVKFGSVYIGDSATVNVSYQGNAQGVIIPTALGVLLRSTQELGGGQLSVSVRGYVKKATRLEVEQYLISLYTTLSTTTDTLTVEYGLTSYTIPNCIWISGSPEGTNKKYSNFTLEFIKSAY